MPKILASGGVNRHTKEKEAERIQDELLKLGCREEDILIENTSTNSLENVLFSKKVLDEQIGLTNIKRIMAVVKHYHSRRALMTLKKHFPHSIDILPVPYDIYGFTKNNWFTSEKEKEKVLGEWKKIQTYLKKGDIAKLDT